VVAAPAPASEAEFIPFDHAVERFSMPTLGDPTPTHTMPSMVFVDFSPTATEELPEGFIPFEYARRRFGGD